jgi:uncharacterized coiled-coil protein SlyX
MSKIPEAYYFYKSHLLKVQKEKEALKKKYEGKISGLNEEISYLKEQIEAQNTMIANSIQYVKKLEKEVQHMGEHLEDKETESSLNAASE